MPSGGSGASGSWDVIHILDLIHVKGGLYLEDEYVEAIPCSGIPDGGETGGETGGNISLEIPQPLLVQLPSSIQEQPGDQPDAVLTPLWTAQTNVIIEQNERLDMIYEDLENKRETLENYQIDYGEIILETLLEEGSEVLLELLIFLPKPVKDLIEKIKKLKAAGSKVAAIVIFLVEVAIALIPKTIKYIVKLYRRARSAIGAIKTENNELLALPKSWDHYHLRLTVLMHHEEAIENLLMEIVKHEEPLNRMNNDMSEVTSVLEKIENTLSGRAEEEEDADLEAFWASVTETLMTILPVENEEEDEDETEKRQLPALPEKYPAGTMTRFLHTLLHIEVYKLQMMQSLTQTIELLQFNGQRLHLPNGDIVELTGVGTVTASPDQF